LTAALEGEPSTIIRNGVLDEQEMRKQTLTHEDLISVLNKNGFNDICDVDVCVLEPNGTFFVKGKTPSEDEIERGELMSAIAQLADEVRSLRRQIEERV
jgi:uncharacterized membrane protein YcaP (DUF421 family)